MTETDHNYDLDELGAFKVQIHEHTTEEVALIEVRLTLPAQTEYPYPTPINRTDSAMNIYLPMVVASRLGAILNKHLNTVLPSPEEGFEQPLIPKKRR